MKPKKMKHRNKNNKQLVNEVNDSKQCLLVN